MTELQSAWGTATPSVRGLDLPCFGLHMFACFLLSTTLGNCTPVAWLVPCGMWWALHALETGLLTECQEVPDCQASV